MSKLRPDGWTHVDDGLPTKNGRYQVAILRGGKYYVTMRKYFKRHPEYFGTNWEKGTAGVRYWKPMSDLPEGCQPITTMDDPYGRITMRFKGE